MKNVKLMVPVQRLETKDCCLIGGLMTLRWNRKKLLILLIGVSAVGTRAVYATTQETKQNTIEPRYQQFLETWQETLEDSRDYYQTLTPADFIEIEDVDASVVHLKEGASITLEVRVPSEGLYHIGFDYYPQGIMNPELSILINDSFPFFESRRVVAPIFWKDESKDFATNHLGHELVPRQIPLESWNFVWAEDSSYLQPEPLRFHLQEGINSITIRNLGGEMLLGNIVIQAPVDLMTYDQYSNHYQDESIQETMIIYEAEHPFKKNSSSVRQMAVQSPDVFPYDSNALLLNTFGGESWFNSGESVTWKLQIEAAGLYAISLKVLQDMTGKAVFRTVLINGEVPFLEMLHYSFAPSKNWYHETLANEREEPYYFYFDEGVHELTLVADASALLPTVISLSQIRGEINELNLAIKQLTGNQIDRNRDWELTEFIPGIKYQLDHWIHLLTESKTVMEELYGSEVASREVVNLNLAINRLKRLTAKPNEIPNRLNELAEGANSVTQLIADAEGLVQIQPLLLDRIYVHGQELITEPTVGFIGRITSGIKQFIASFTRPTLDPSTVAEQTLDIWVSRSQQHVELLQDLADRTFTLETGIQVQLSVMPNESKLILANAGNQQPDVALGVSVGSPYELAIRGAALDLSQFSDFITYIEKFSPGAFMPMMVDNKVYAIPETQDFYVLFYRKDLFERLKMPIPDTWSDVIEILPELQRHGLDFFIPLSGSAANKPFMFTAPFIYQFGSDFYIEDGTQTAIDSEAALEAIGFMSDLYTLYSLPLQVGSFYHSFRYGQIPIGIGNFETYIQLTVAAPELAGSWDIALHPGVQQDDGTVQRWATGSAQQAMIFSGSEKQEEAWEFLKWWMDTETQVQYATTLRTLYGTEYLWNSANLEAFKQLPLPPQHKDVILQQWDYLMEVPKTPGAYIIEREVSNVWNKVVFEGANLRSTIDDSVVIINREIRRKLEEFGYMEDGQVVKPYILPRLRTVLEWINDETES